MAESDPTATQTAATEKPIAVAAPAVDVQAQINQAVADSEAKREAALRAELKEITGFSSLAEFKEAQLAEQGKTQELLDSKSSELTAVKKRFHNSQINSALLTASAAAIDPGTVVDLLHAKSVCDDDGNVTVNGKTPEQAVKELLDAKPFLAKANGSTGSGAQTQTDAVEVDNPWSTKTWNLTEQMRIKKQNPSLAEQLKAAAIK